MLLFKIENYPIIATSRRKINNFVWFGFGVNLTPHTHFYNIEQPILIGVTTFAL